jgi:hypothetical protein
MSAAQITTTMLISKLRSVMAEVIVLCVRQIVRGTSDGLSNAKYSCFPAREV